MKNTLTANDTNSNGALSPFVLLFAWLSTVLVTFLLAWHLVPLVVDRLPIPAALTYWAILMLSPVWQIGLSLWLNYRQAGNLNWVTLSHLSRLSLPVDPKTSQARLSLLWRGLRSWPLVFLIIGVGGIVPVVIFIIQSLLRHDFATSPLSSWPAYSGILEFTSTEFSQQWWMIPVVLLGWFIFVFSEELFFRGLLLPGLHRVFPKRGSLINGFLFGLYSLYRYWLIPFCFLEGWILARAAKRYQSTWMALVVRGVEGVCVGLLILFGVTAQPLTNSTRPVVFPYIGNHPVPLILNPGKLASIPSYNPGNTEQFQVDLRGADLSGLDLQNRARDLSNADFDSHTLWPGQEYLPADFDPSQVLETGKNPGLSVRELHAQGITGKGVGVAIIDQALLTGHIEYADRLRWYEELPGYPATAQMHGSSVASIAVGRTVGVAPEADLYYISGAGSQISTFWALGHEYAQGIRRIVQINRSLPAERKIRVISISSNWLPNLPGYQDVMRAVREAEDAGMMVVRTDKATGMPEKMFPYGLGRPVFADPDSFQSYEPGLWWRFRFYNPGVPIIESGQESKFLFPMDSRTMASPTGEENYFFNRLGGQSWVMPYIAGLYALAAQVDPAVTPEKFWLAAIQTGRTIDVQHNSQTYPLRIVVDPAELVRYLVETEE